MKNASALVPIYVAAFTAACSFSLLFPVMSLYAAELGASVSRVGLVVATYSYVTAATLIPLGMLSDRLGRLKLVIAGLVVFAVAPLLYPLATDPQQLVAVRAVHGLAGGAFLPAAIAMVIDLTPAERRGQAIGWYTMSLQMGLMAGPITGGFLLSRFGFNGAFYSCSALSLLGLGSILLRPRITGQPPELDEASTWGWLKQALAFAGLLTPLFIATGSGTIAAYVPLYGRGFGISEASAGAIITAVYVGSASLRPPAGILSDRIGRKPMIISGLALGAVAVALMSRFHGLPELVIVAVFFGIGIGLAIPASLALVADLSSAGRRGLAMSIPTCFFQVGLAIGATAMGFVAEMSSFETMFVACGSTLAFGLLLIFGLMRGR